MSPKVPIALILERPGLSDDALEAVCCVARALGMEPTDALGTTISARIELERFAKLFGVSPRRLRPAGPAVEEIGGFYCDEQLKVPKELAPFVRAVTVEPIQARRAHE